MPKAVSVNPATEEVMAKFDYLSARKAADEVRLSRAASLSWGAMGLGERCSLLRSAASVLKKGSKGYGELISREMGKPIGQAVAEVEKCAWACEYYAQNAPEFLADVPVQTEAAKSYVSFQPLGTILGIMPWNFPFWQVFRFAASTLAAGNAVVVKHSSNVPQCGVAIEEVFREAGFPDHVYRNLIIDSDAVKSIVEADLVEGLSLTGSTEAGSRIGELAGRNIKKAVLELGGSDPFVVLSGADTVKAARTAAMARFQNAGQSCIAGKRFIIHKDAVAAFREEFVSEAAKLVMGDPLDPNTGLGPLARGDLREALEAQLRSMVREKAKVLTGGKRPEGKGFFFEPTVVEAPKTSKTVMSEETFGPLASIIVGRDDAELLALANGTRYGLGASVWCEDRERAESFAKGVQSGMVVVNNMVRSDPRLPFGGVKKSGVGRELGRFGILEFASIKSVIVN